MLYWWGILLFIGVCFTAVCVGMVIGQLQGSKMVLGIEVSVFNVFSIAHVGLALFLIFLGRLVVSRKRKSDPQKLASI
jgi:hypothetical protein